MQSVRTGGNMANVTSAIDKSIDNNNNDKNSVIVSLLALEINGLHRD